MSTPQDATPLTTHIGAELPYLRRYGRALTGSQKSGDAYAAATLEAILEDTSAFEGNIAPKTALFRVFHSIWDSSGSRIEDASDGLEAKAQAHLSRLTKNTREALLLRSLEDFPPAEVATIMQIDLSEVEHLLSVAEQELSDAIQGRVLIIEDEAIIAMDLEALVKSMGHEVVGLAPTRTDAVEMGKKERPDLILADIHLADKSSGIDAVNDLLGHFGEIPVIFITAYPERLLTGERPEPAFLISKPYVEDQVRSAVGQAMFFSSTETLKA
ncbi:response regulator [Aestuariibius insulae]|uniref:response regulator n=1 Tax=Aestuariibius insulae TaxID=2058287 RepID=UPI00345E522E